ncbi:hypothetical protein OH779_33605 [Actinacidiphila glaucinigra]|uniref:hypothetical protein n=1 Tax=Actinacidiphila glaucinigra TaxID=235986 RepID=UPI003870CF76
MTVTTPPGGRRTATVQPGPGREHMPFKTLEGDGKALTVMPFDAETLVAAGTILAGLNPQISDVRQSR